MPLGLSPHRVHRLKHETETSAVKFADKFLHFFKRVFPIKKEAHLSGFALRHINPLIEVNMRNGRAIIGGFQAWSDCIFVRHLTRKPYQRMKVNSPVTA